MKVLAILLRKRKITREFIRMLDGWRHSGFNVFGGGRIQPREKKSLENLTNGILPRAGHGPLPLQGW